MPPEPCQEDCTNRLKQWGALATATGLGAVGVAAFAVAASADGGGSREPFTITERLSGFRETPLALSTSGQDIAPGEFSELLAAIRADSTYANVHSTKYPGGEIRNQLSAHDDH